MKLRIITRNELIEIIARPLNIPEKYLVKIQLNLARMDEFDFLKYANTIIPGRINRIIKNRY